MLMALFAGFTFGQAGDKGAFPERRIGGANPDVTVEIFLDLQCPACAALFTRGLLDDLKSRYADRVVVIVRHYPLLSIHDDAFYAACAVEAAALQGKFSEMALKVMAEQRNWPRKRNYKNVGIVRMMSTPPQFDRKVRAKFISYAGQLKLDLGIFRSDLDSEFVKQRVFADLSRARSLNLSSTPTVLLNGEDVGFDRLSSLTELIAEKLRN